MVELSNGCICCSINDELLDAVYRILDRPDPVDYLVVETTGLADPLPVAMTFWAAIYGIRPGWTRSSRWSMPRTSATRSSMGKWPVPRWSMATSFCSTSATW